MYWPFVDLEAVQLHLSWNRDASPYAKIIDPVSTRYSPADVTKLVTKAEAPETPDAPRLRPALGQAVAISVACTLVTTPIAWWHFGRLAPLALSALLTLARVLGWMSANWLTQYAVVASMALELVRSFSNLYLPNTWQLVLGVFLLGVILFLPRGIGSLWIANRNKRKSPAATAATGAIHRATV